MKNSLKSQEGTYLYLDLRAESGIMPERSWEMVTVSPGASSMRNISQAPRNGGSVSSLSQILQANAPEKYYLSAKACQGILNRAKKRGKELPTMLKEALEEVIALETCADSRLDTICHSAGFNDATGERAKGSMEYCEERSPTLRAGDVKSVVYDARGNGDGKIVPTLTGDHKNRVTDYTAVCIGNGQLHNISMAEQMNTLTCMHDQQAVLTDGKPPRRYIIRRLTPLECCRLQGFPDGWGIHDHKGRLSDDELVFWQGVRDTCAGIAGKPPKKYSAEALTKWYNGLHTDSAEYKMWGNGIALPCAEYVMEGIADELKEAAQCTKA